MAIIIYVFFGVVKQLFCDAAIFFCIYAKIIKKFVAFSKHICYYILARGSDSVVECHLAKVEVAGPNPVSRSREVTWITRVIREIPLN